MSCSLCPRKCNADRDARRGYCGASRGVEAATVCLHRGEEPPISGTKGIVNVFFTHCNLQCLYCQNHAISGRDVNPSLARFGSVEAIATEVERLLPASEGAVGFVTPSHCPEAVIGVVERLHSDGFEPTVVYNTGGYDSIETLRQLEPYVDIYLPDFKYANAALASRLSHAPDYPDVALRALREMYRQKGSGLLLDDRGMAYRGMIVRHLVLPGHVDNSLAALDMLCDALPLNLHISLMAQYFPPADCGQLLQAGEPELCRTLSAEEYALVANRYDELGYYNGWLQELSAEANYRPDFSRNTNPFEQ
ncbi:MAG: radical SAM protein [Bacteroidales bacterium]|nr:radical SAM protein [Bacteroidales bacterium]